MIPIFKSHYSMNGRSILTLDDKTKEGGADSIFSILEENGLKELCLVEDSLSGFPTAFRKCKEKGIALRFGWRAALGEGENKQGKVILFAENDQGCKDLNKIYSESHTLNDGMIKPSALKHLSDNLMLVIPFYDSFIFENVMNLGHCQPDFGENEVTFLIENNGLPFDGIVKRAVNKFIDTNTEKYSTTKAKSIYYKRKSDAKALQVYKIACNRSGGRQADLGNPNLSHFGSDEFCWESYLEQNKK